MLIDKLENIWREKAQRLNGKAQNVFRASSSGHCARALGYQKIGIAGEPLTPRRMAVFEHGHTLDWALKRDLADALGDKFINLDLLPPNKFFIDDIEIGFTPDGAFETDDGQIGIVEFKTMSEYSFERALKGEIDRGYLCQAWCYYLGTGFNPICFIAYRKNTSHYAEIVFDRNVRERVVTQRFGGDPKEIYLNDPLLISTISTPFDPSVETEVREKFKALAALKDESGLAPRLIVNDRGEPVIKDETISVQGQANAAAYANANGTNLSKATKSGSWYKFLTGRKVVNFPCDYCQMLRICREGVELEIVGDKPKWVISNEDTEKALGGIIK